MRYGAIIIINLYLIPELFKKKKKNVLELVAVLRVGTGCKAGIRFS